MAARHPAALLATPTTTVGAADYTVLTKLSATCCYRGVESLTLTVAVTKGAAQLTALLSRGREINHVGCGAKWFRGCDV